MFTSVSNLFLKIFYLIYFLFRQVTSYNKLYIISGENQFSLLSIKIYFLNKNIFHLQDICFRK